MDKNRPTAEIKSLANPMIDILKQLKDTIGNEKVLTGNQLESRYSHIWRMGEPLQAKALLLPTSTEDVAQMLKICHQHKQPVIVHGGLTNLVGGTETLANQIVLSTEKLNKVIELDASSRSITVEAGVILETVQATAQQHDLLFPLNFGAKGTAQIGGIISTNAGGLRVVKYGMTRNLVLGLEVVLADGTILSNLKKIIKDNSGYDLKQLFIGAEGTLGVITKAVLKLKEAPKSRTSAWIGLNSYENVVRFLKKADRSLAGTLSAFELVWKDTFRAMTSPPSQNKSPLDLDFEFYVLLESLGSHPTNDQDTMEALLAEALEANLIMDAAMATNAADLTWFWKIREDVRVLSSQANNDHHFDISLPIPLIGDYLETVRKALMELPEVEQVFTFGHVADGNIHLVIGKQNNSKELTTTINQLVYDQIKAVNGSVSAEHGIGQDKKMYLNRSKTEAEIQLMKVLKRTLDPTNILNPGRIFDV